ncbi:MAG: hypothetical protein HZA16_10375 [Nitrospirae bacterium]|nr:hypothetical protein [Nitrospirota bacterium]
MTAEGPLKIISVAGAHSGVGKTSLCSILLKDLKGYGAIKFTKTALYTSVVDDERVLCEPGKDTQVYLESGAERVVWVQSPGGDELEEALDIALTRMAGLKGVVIEGNSPLRFLRPDLAIFLVQEEGRTKPSAEAAGGRADIIIINSEKEIKDTMLSAEILQKGAKVFRINAVGKKGEIDKFLAYVREYIKFAE